MDHDILECPSQSIHRRLPLPFDPSHHAVCPHPLLGRVRVISVIRSVLVVAREDHLLESAWSIEKTMCSSRTINADLEVKEVSFHSEGRLDCSPVPTLSQCCIRVFGPTI